jgi:hypothetical protein
VEFLPDNGHAVPCESGARGSGDSRGRGNGVAVARGAGSQPRRWKWLTVTAAAPPKVKGSPECFSVGRSLATRRVAQGSLSSGKSL